MNSLRFLVPFLLCPLLQSPANLSMQLESESHHALPVRKTTANVAGIASPTAELTAAAAPVAESTAAVPAVPDSEEDKFSFGKVVAVGAHSVVVREYDFERDADVDVRYWITGETELGRVESLADLVADDDVVIDYIEIGSDRVATTLLKELPNPDAGLQGVYGTIVAIEAGAITVRQYNRGRDDDVEVRYVVTGDTELCNLASLGDFAVGDEIMIDFIEVDGLAGATALTKITGGEAIAEESAATERCLPCVVSKIDENGAAQLRVTNPALAGDVSGDCELDSEVVLLNLDSLADIRERDLLDVVFSRIEGKWVVVGVSRSDGP